jgi:hypothetical protein
MEVLLHIALALVLGVLNIDFDKVRLASHDPLGEWKGLLHIASALVVRGFDGSEISIM